MQVIDISKLSGTVENNYWFINHAVAIYEMYGNCYVVIHNKSVCGDFDTEEEATEFAERINIGGDCIVQKLDKRYSADVFWNSIVNSKIIYGDRYENITDNKVFGDCADSKQ